VTQIRKSIEYALLVEATSLQEAMEVVTWWNLQKTIIELNAKAL
jgi:hypothetical protein